MNSIPLIRKSPCKSGSFYDHEFPYHLSPCPELLNGLFASMPRFGQDFQIKRFELS